MVVAFMQTRVHKTKDINYITPNLGILLIDFFNTYISCKFQTIEIKPFPPGAPITGYAISTKLNEQPTMRVIDPFSGENSNSNLTKSSYNFLFLENLFYFVYFVIFQKSDEPVLLRIFQTAKLFNQMGPLKKKYS